VRPAWTSGFHPVTLTGMGKPWYSIPVDELVGRARVPVADQVEVQAEPQHPAPDWSTGLVPCADGMSCDADGN
jgi:hypothetical protein